MPMLSATPMASIAAMNSTSTTPLPARERKASAKGASADPRKPFVGLPPASQDLAGVVSCPSPNSLSRNTQRNTQSRARRMPASRYRVVEPS